MNIRYLELNRISESFQPELDLCIRDVTASGIYLYGERLRTFEAEYAAYTGNSYCIGVGNGYDALKISLMALKDYYGWTDKAEVIVPAMTFVATPLAVRHAGLKVVFSDVNADGLIDVECLRNLVGENTRCILPVHLYGKMCDMRALSSFAAERGIVLLEDAAQCHGAYADGIRPGNVSAAAAFSFYPAKNLGALADAGCVVTDNPKIADAVRILANYGSDKKYVHRLKGENSRLDELNAAVLSLKLARLDDDNRKRREIARRYSSEIKNPAVTVPYRGSVGESVFHIYPLLVEDREVFQRYMLEHGIETGVHYPIACHRQECFAESEALSLPCAEKWADCEISLPISPLLTEEEAAYIIRTVNDYQK